MRRVRFHLLMTLLLAAPAWAEAEPAVALLPQTIQWLTTPPTPTQIAPALADGAMAVAFDTKTSTSASDMAARFEGATVLAATISQGLPSTLASDLSQQLAVTDLVPLTTVATLIVDKDRASRADRTAANWVNDLLKPKPDDQVGAYVLWYADTKTHSLLSGAAPEPKLVMVLFSAQVTDGQPPRITSIAWGVLGSPKK